jgi:protoporphyrinogen/coproporphyrinogen III oxidase
MTVNLFFPERDLLPVSGFGYLIPESIPFDQNPERALGVIFDSDTVKAQDTVSGTKVTVMLGGRWWDGWTDFPDSKEGLEMARSILARHLGITAEPVASQVNLNKECIPQYTVGYAERVKMYAQELASTYQGRVKVVGNQYNGVGVNDCILGAWTLATSMQGGRWKEGTGLERFLDERPWRVKSTE